MKTEDAPSSPQREANRQALTCIGIFAFASCLLILIFGLLAWALAPLYPLIASQITRLSSDVAANIAARERAEAGTPANVLFVRSDGTSGTCASWENACGLQWALQKAAAGEEIWVQEGIYRPAANSRAVGATFLLKNGVALYGGFAGTETAREQRDWRAHITVLSGDLAGDDTTDPNGVVTDTANIAGPNSFHVVSGSGVGATAVLDGFTITAGYANLPPPNIHGYGGGMFNWAGSPTVNNVVFSGNTAGKGAPGYGGGGMFNIYSSDPTLTNVTFVANTAGGGAGMYNHESNPTLNGVVFTGNKAVSSAGMENYSNSSPTLNDVTFSGNVATVNAGGMGITAGSKPVLSHVTFADNSAGDYGGGIGNFGGSPTLTDVEFSGNRAGREGGGMYNGTSGTSLLTNVTFVNNSTAGTGGGMLNHETTAELTNVTFSGNSAGEFGGGLANTFSSTAFLVNVTITGNKAPHGSGVCSVGGSFRLINGIVWGNTPGQDQIYNDNVTPNISYSDIQGGWSGTGNLDADPRLSLLGDDGPTGVFALSSGSPAIDAGNRGICPGTDQLGLPRPADGDGDGSALCDMGAFEYQPPK